MKIGFTDLNVDILDRVRDEPGRWLGAVAFEYPFPVSRGRITSVRSDSTVTVWLWRDEADFRRQKRAGELIVKNTGTDQAPVLKIRSMVIDNPGQFPPKISFEWDDTLRLRAG